MYPRFGLTLMVTHACNLRCTYCYTGAKFDRPMPFDVGRQAIDRALASLEPGGALELAFFGGEPLLEPGLIERLARYAAERAASRRQHLHLALTTNGAVVTAAAWSIMTRPDLDLSISCDGDAPSHDRHRVAVGGGGTARLVHETIRRLVQAGRPFRVVLVVRPDTVADLAANLRFLQQLGVRAIQPSLDLWARWSTADIAALQASVAECAALWRQSLPALAVSWFDEKAAHLSELPIPPSPRCGFGQGEVAVAPSGRIYPCERLIGPDDPGNTFALFGVAHEGADFLDFPKDSSHRHPSCDGCAMLGDCSTFCRCSNFVRTGDVSRPDGLLCAWNQSCLAETARVLGGPLNIPLPVHA